ncbi:uncharacterized protein BDW70DRAFT_120598 [Aspergillus foveolatus]|uniref:uncharacterized protein n=1 Tax=Aspergillus foveolatus TaxID=210207 RepID=UPI003CCE41F1
MPGWGLPGRELCDSHFKLNTLPSLVSSLLINLHFTLRQHLLLISRSTKKTVSLSANFTTLSPSLSQSLSRRIKMPSYLAPSQIPEAYRPLSALSGSFDMETSPALHYTRSHRGHGISQFQRPNYFSSSSLYICCKCNDGPKVYTHNVQCVMCHHIACDLCTHVK